MKINDASRATGVSRDMIRFYEKHGIHADGKGQHLEALAADVIRMTMEKQEI